MDDDIHRLKVGG